MFYLFLQKHACTPSCVVAVCVQGLPQGGWVGPMTNQMQSKVLLLKEYPVAYDTQR